MSQVEELAWYPGGKERRPAYQGHSSQDGGGRAGRSQESGSHGKAGVFIPSKMGPLGCGGLTGNEGDQGKGSSIV